MKTSEYQPSYSPARKCLIITSAFMLLISLTMLGLTSYQARNHCSVQVYDSPSVDCDDSGNGVPICDQAPAVTFEYLTVTPSLAFYEYVRCSWRSRASVPSIIASVCCIILSSLFLGAALGGSARGWAIPLVLLSIITWLIMLASIILQGLDLTKGDNFASDYIRTGTQRIEQQPGVIFSQAGYGRGNFIATIILFCIVFVGLLFLLISYFKDRAGIPRRESASGRQSIPTAVPTKAAMQPAIFQPGAMQPGTTVTERKVEIVDVRGAGAAPGQYLGVAAPYTTGRPEGLNISQEPAPNRINVSV